MSRVQSHTQVYYKYLLQFKHLVRCKTVLITNNLVLMNTKSSALLNSNVAWWVIEEKRWWEGIGVFICHTTTLIDTLPPVLAGGEMKAYIPCREGEWPSERTSGRKRIIHSVQLSWSDEFPILFLLGHNTVQYNTICLNTLQILFLI
jgi:hypothetical protein